MIGSSSSKWLNLRKARPAQLRLNDGNHDAYVESIRQAVGGIHRRDAHVEIHRQLEVDSIIFENWHAIL